VIGIVGALIIFFSSWLMTAVIFPDYYEQLADGYRDSFEGSGMSAEKVDEAMQGIEGSTPVSGALTGSVGTVITSIAVAAIAGVFLRKK
jgi:hypothetical protein